MEEHLEEGKKRMETVFDRAGLHLREEGLSPRPSIPDAFGGILLPDGSCLIWAARDFSLDDLCGLSRVIKRPEEAIIIFPERIMNDMPEQDSRWVINRVSPAVVSREMVLRHAACIIHRGAVIFIGYHPDDEGVLILPHASAELLIYSRTRT